jgi:hypothetical protein
MIIKLVCSVVDRVHLKVTITLFAAKVAAAVSRTLHEMKTQTGEAVSLQPSVVPCVILVCSVHERVQGAQVGADADSARLHYWWALPTSYDSRLWMTCVEIVISDRLSRSGGTAGGLCLLRHFQQLPVL